MYKKNKRAISPLIATVLVIGFTIVLAGVVMQFLVPLFTQSTEKSKADAALLNACGQFSTNLVLKNVVKADNGDVNFVIDNPTPTDVQDVVVKYYAADGTAGSCPLLGAAGVPKIVKGGILSVSLKTTGGLCTYPAAAEFTVAPFAQLQGTFPSFIRCPGAHVKVIPP